MTPPFPQYSTRNGWVCIVYYKLLLIKIKALVFSGGNHAIYEKDIHESIG